MPRMPRMFCSCLARPPRMPCLPRWPYLVLHAHVCSALPPKGDLSIGMKGIQLNLSTTVTLGTEESGRCGEVAVMGR